MTKEEKFEKIAAKDFTYVSVHYIDGDGELQFDKFVVLTPSKPEARRAVDAIVPQRLGEAGKIMWHRGARLNHGVPNSGATVSLYPRNYVVEAKHMLRDTPSNVYVVKFETSVSFSS